MNPMMPRLPKDKARVHGIPIWSLRARATGSRPGPGALRPSANAAETALSIPPIRDVEMLREPAALELPMVRSAPVAGAAGCRVSRAAVRSFYEPDWFSNAAPASFSSRTADTGISPGDAGTLARRVPKAVDATNTITRFPHTRRGLVPRQIGGEEIESHLNEARATKGVAPENASLIAVFRRIPVELVSHVRIDESRRLLLFRLEPCQGRRSTRVYDMAAIRDISTGRLHLVPHRTRNRTVLLS